MARIGQGLIGQPSVGTTHWDILPDTCPALVPAHRVRRQVVSLLCGLPIVLAGLAGGFVGEQVVLLLFPSRLTITYLLLGLAVFSYNAEATKTLVAQPSF